MSDCPKPTSFEKAIGSRIELPFVNVGTGKARREWEEAAAKRNEQERLYNESSSNVPVKIVSSK